MDDITKKPYREVKLRDLVKAISNELGDEHYVRVGGSYVMITFQSGEYIALMKNQGLFFLQWLLDGGSPSWQEYVQSNKRKML